MKIKWIGLLTLLSTAVTRPVFAQAPSISYSPATYALTTGAPFSISPTNTGGAIPATVYGQVSLLAGPTSYAPGYVNATGSAARFNWPQGIVVDASGNSYIGDSNNNAIRKVTPAGVVTTFAGSLSGTAGYTDATGTSALFNAPFGIAIDGSGNLYVCDYSNGAIRKITPAGVVTTFYHNTGAFGPSGACFDSSGNLFVVAQDANQIWKITSSGVQSVFAGNYGGFVNGTGTAALFLVPTDLRVDVSGNLYVADYQNNAIRKITPAGVVTTLAGNSTAGYANGIGTAAKFNNPTSMAVSSTGIVYITDFLNNDIRQIMPDGTVTLLAGSATQAAGDADGTGTAAGFNQPDAMYLDAAGNGYIAELIGSRVRKIVLTGYTLKGALPPGLTFDAATGIISGSATGSFAALTDTITGYNTGGYSSATVTFSSAATLAAPNIAYTMETDTLKVGTAFSFTPTNSGGAVPASVYSQVGTVAGNNTGGFVNGTGSSAQFNAPMAMAGDASGNLYIADANNNVIRKVSPAGAVTSFAGSAAGASGYTNATGTSALFNAPDGLAFDASANLYVSDYSNNAIRKITPAGVVSTFYHSTGTFGPSGLLVDGLGNVIVAAQDLSQILKITPAGVVTTIAGSSSGYVNATGTSAKFSSPTDVKMDASGNLFVADYLNNAIRKITPAGVVTTFAGSSVSGNIGGYTDSIGTAARFNSPTGLSITPGGVIYVADLNNNAIRRIMPDGTVSLAAGSTAHTAGGADGVGTAAQFNEPNYLYIDGNGNGFVTELAGNKIRKVALTGYSLSGILPSGMTFDSTTGTVSGTPAAGISATPITVTAFNTAGFSPAIILIATSFNWIGLTSTDWTTATNWSSTKVPSSSDQAQIGVIAYTGTFQPTVGTNATVSKILFGAHNSPVLTVNPSATLTVSLGIQVPSPAVIGINGPGSLILSAASLINAGASLNFGTNLNTNLTGTLSSLVNNGTLALATGTNLTISSATLTNGGVISIAPNANLNLSSGIITNGGTLTMAPVSNLTLSGTASITTTGTFTLGSDPTGSASIAAIPPTASITGTVSVQRFITGGIDYRGYRLLSSPVYAAAVSSNNVYSINYLQNSCYVTGDNTAGGFDFVDNPSVYLYRENMQPCNTSFTCGNFRGIGAINATPNYNYTMDIDGGPYNIPVGNGYLFFFRGDRSQATVAQETVSTYVPTNTILTTSGSLNQQSIVVKDWFTPGTSNLSYTSASPAGVIGLNLVGNPYPSTIDWKQFSSTVSTNGIYGPSVYTTITELNPANSSYGTYDAISDLATNNASRYVASGQGFFVQALNGSASLTFNESAKTNAQPVTGTSLFLSRSPIQGNNIQYLRLEMNLDTLHYEDILIKFNTGAKPTFDPHEDALYKLGFNKVSLSSLSKDHVQLAVNQLPLPTIEKQMIGLNIGMTESGTYHFKRRELVSISNLYDIWLMDAFKKDSVDMRATSSYDFKVDKADSSTFGDKRFSLVIRQNPAYAYRLLDFTANKVQNIHQVQVIWKTQNEGNYTNFTVERSIDGGKTFDILGNDKAAGLGSYGLLDKNPVIGQNLYRLKQEDVNNVITYSKIATVQYANHGDQSLSNLLTIYPNPASSTINLSFVANANNSGGYKLRITGSTGSVVREVNIAQASWQGNVSNLLPGTYLVRVIDNKTQSVIAENKFVKL